VGKRRRAASFAHSAETRLWRYANFVGHCSAIGRFLFGVKAKEFRHGKGCLCPLRRSGRWLFEILARDDLPKIERYPGGQMLPTPMAIDFKPGALLGSVSGELGLRNISSRTVTTSL
jgi:hypothetical protein